MPYEFQVVVDCAQRHVANDQHAVAMYTVRAEREGRQLDDNEVLVSHPSPDGKATEVWTQNNDIYAFDEFWS